MPLPAAGGSCSHNTYLDVEKNLSHSRDTEFVLDPGPTFFVSGALY